ncbi:hypothetical protein QFC20_007036 [Naganishia adeliensis]|uniref:Uncharacterized protein n=1 Tax=Naganishia adeliensis TaxID=92952 RepID=A0ACC2V3Y8_9TREE|nr:hypothetical protein QFC20_007036 [Naganishia adeliensis]
MSTNSSELQLRIHLEQNAIRSEAPETFVNRPLERQYELQRLSEIQERLSFLQYGQNPDDKRIYQVSASNVSDVNFIAVADGDVFLPVRHPGEEGIQGIARYRLDDCRKAPDILGFGRVVRHYQVDPAEGVLLLVFQDEP